MESFDLDKLRSGEAAVVKMEFLVNDAVQGAFELRISGKGAQRGDTPPVPAQSSSGDTSPAAALAAPSLLSLLLLVLAALVMH